MRYHLRKGRDSRKSTARLRLVVTFFCASLVTASASAQEPRSEPAARDLRAQSANPRPTTEDLEGIHRSSHGIDGSCLRCHQIDVHQQGAWHTWKEMVNQEGVRLDGCARDEGKTEEVTWLGVALSVVPDALQKHLRGPEHVGLLVENVEPDSPAAKAGVERFDVLNRIEDQLLINQAQFSVLIRTYAAGQAVSLEVIHQGETKVVGATLEKHVVPVADQAAQSAEHELLLERSNVAGYYDRLRLTGEATSTTQVPSEDLKFTEDVHQPDQDAAPTVTTAFLGINSSSPSDALMAQLRLVRGTGLLVDSVEPGSAAQSAGIEAQDVLLSIDGQILINGEQLRVLVTRHRPGDMVVLRLIHAGKEVTVQAKLGERVTSVTNDADAFRRGLEFLSRAQNDARGPVHELALQEMLRASRSDQAERLASLLTLAATRQAADKDQDASQATQEAEFLRRAYLDALGVLPTAEDIKRFQSDARVDKRERLIDELLARPEWISRLDGLRTIQWSDDQQHLTLTVDQDGQRTLLVKDTHGEPIQRLSVSTEEELLGLDANLGAKARVMLRALERNQQLTDLRDLPAGDLASALGGQSTAEAQLEQILDAVEFENVPLSGIIEQLRERTGANLVLNAKALRQAGLEVDEPLSLSLRKVRLSTLLNTLLALACGENARLGFQARGEVILISTVPSDR